jgi:hypothetical protein
MAGRDGTDSIPMISNVTYLKMRLEERLASILPGLLLDIDDIAYIQHNDKRNSYLYTICAMILDCQSNQINIYHTPDGLDRKDGEEWNLLKNSNSEEYKAGTYMCKCLSGILYYYVIDQLDVTIISLEKLSRAESANSTPWTSTPASPAKQTASPITQPAISSPSLGIEENPCLETTRLKRKRKGISVPSISCIFFDYLFYNPDKFRSDIISRDRECIVTGSMPVCCIATHLIPVRVLQARFSDGGVKTRKHTFNDPYDSRVGVLLDPGVDRCVDQFWSSFIVSVRFLLSTLIIGGRFSNFPQLQNLYPPN